LHRELFDEFNYGFIIGDDCIGKGIFPFRCSLGEANAWQGITAASSRQYRIGLLWPSAFDTRICSIEEPQLQL
jgi:hypothetical protein